MLFSELPESIQVYLREKSKNKIVVLPEGEDARIKQAALILKNEFDVHSILGSEKFGLDLKEKTLKALEFISQQKGKPPSEKILDQRHDATFAAGALLLFGEVDAVISGCTLPTSHVIRAALSTVGLKKESKIVTSAFLFSLLKPTMGEQNLILYSDCAVIPVPNSEELCSIAYLASQAFLKWTNIEPRISFLSFSTAGSANHPEVDKVKNAHQLFSSLYPSIISEGEVQFDAACIPSISKRKNAGGLINGKTNIFIFPDLNSGNISYKITQYLAGGKAWGPILLGIEKPFSDLSRGSSPEEIAQSAILTLALSS